MEAAPPPHHGQRNEKEIKVLFESFGEGFKQCRGRDWHSRMSVIKSLHYLRTGELQGQLQHRPGEMGRGNAQRVSCGFALASRTTAGEHQARGANQANRTEGESLACDDEVRALPVMTTEVTAEVTL